MRGLTLLELIIVLTIIVAISTVLGVNLFDFQAIRTRNNAERIVSVINEALSLSVSEKKTYGLLADLKNRELILVQLNPTVEIPCDQTQQLACEFTKMYIPAAADLLSLLTNLNQLPEDRIKIVSRERLQFITPQEKVYILVFDHFKILGDLLQSYNINGVDVTIAINPILRIAGLRS